MRKLRLIVSALFVSAAALAGDVQTSGNNVTIRPDGGEAKVIRLEVMNDNIIRVRATSKDALPEKPASLMIVPQTTVVKNVSIEKDNEKVTVKAKNVTAVVQMATGQVTFYDANVMNMSRSTLVKMAKFAITRFMPVIIIS